MQGTKESRGRGKAQMSAGEEEAEEEMMRTGREKQRESRLELGR